MCHALISIWKNEGGKGDTNIISLNYFWELVLEFETVSSNSQNYTYSREYSLPFNLTY